MISAALEVMRLTPTHDRVALESAVKHLGSVYSQWCATPETPTAEDAHDLLKVVSMLSSRLFQTEDITPLWNLWLDAAARLGDTSWKRKNPIKPAPTIPRRRVQPLHGLSEMGLA
jgi:hypothetical protein